MLAFDWTISVGNLLTAGLVIGGWFYAFFQLKGDVRVVRHDMSTIKQRQEGFNESLSQLTAILTKLAVQEERLSGMQEDIRDLRKGKGWITEEITGEYSRHGKLK